MYTRQELMELEKIQLETINTSMLQELNDIKINQDMDIEERLDTFFRQIKNPYCFLINGTPVQISFQNHNQTIDDCLTHYFNDKKNADNKII